MTGDGGARSDRGAEHAASQAQPQRIDGLLSVVVVSHNGRELLMACLDSLQREREAGPCEVIVVDNASTDGAVAAVRELHPWVRLVESGDNHGFARAANRGLRLCRGEFLLLLNPDTVVPTGGLRRCVDEMRSRPEVGILGCRLVRPDGTLDHACKRSFPTPVSALAHMARLSRISAHPRLRRYTAEHVGEHEVAPVDAVNGAFMLLRGAALDRVGPLDERYWMYGEDLDLCFRFGAAGWTVLYWPEVTVVHVKGGISGRHRTWRINLAFHRAMWLFFSRHQAHTYPRVVRSAVWMAIWLKLGLSATRSAGARSARRLSARS